VKPYILIAIERSLFDTVFSTVDLERLSALGNLLNPDPPEKADKAFLLDAIGEADIVMTCWETAAFDAEIVEAASRLKLLCHAAGTVRPVVTEALWDTDVRVTSAAAALAYGVAEFCLGQILMATKRVPWLSEGTRQGYWQEAGSCFGGGFEIYQQKIGLIGAGHIGRQLLRLLENFDCEKLLYDPFCSEEEATAMGARKVESLEELFVSCRVVSLHAPTNEDTRHMLRGHHFAALPKGSVFVNTAGWSQIHEEEFVGELRKGRFIACIDRCEDEPCAMDHPYRHLPNVWLTPHIAGVMAENRFRVGTFVANEVENFVKGSPLTYEVTRSGLARMA